MRQEEWLPTKDDNTPIQGKKKIGRVANAGVVGVFEFGLGVRARVQVRVSRGGVAAARATRAQRSVSPAR